MDEHHATLGLEPGADEDEIRRAFRRLALRAHPDRNPAPGADDRMRLLVEARDALLSRLAHRRPVHFDDFLDRVVVSTIGRADTSLGRKLARLIHRDPNAGIRIVGVPRRP